MPDWNYGRWVADAYREARETSQPLLEEVKAVVNWPEVGTFSHAYWRLIVPLEQRGRPTRLLGVTVDNADLGSQGPLRYSSRSATIEFACSTEAPQGTFPSVYS